MHFFCKNNDYPAYIDYGKEPPPAATTVIHPKSRIPSFSLDKPDQGIPNSSRRACMPNTCANKGVCKETYEDDILNAAFVRQQYSNDNGKDSMWMAASLISICDCDLTTYTGPTCEEGNETYIHMFLVERTRRHKNNTEC